MQREAIANVTTYVQLTVWMVHYFVYLSNLWCLGPKSCKQSCPNASMTDISFIKCRSFMYLPFLANTCLSGIQLTVKSAGTILWMSEKFTFLNLPVGSATSNFNFTTLKFDTYFMSHVDVFIKIHYLLLSHLFCNGRHCHACHIVA